jgi:TetR/AcrR family transcriptional regulator, cholesterol catabolism regulator
MPSDDDENKATARPQGFGPRTTLMSPSSGAAHPDARPGSIPSTAASIGPNTQVRRTTRTEKRENTRAVIFRCARELFMEQGFSSVKIEHIADRAQVAPGTVMLHFGTKQRLLNAIAIEDLGMQVNAMFAAFDSRPDRPLVERLLGAFRLAYSFQEAQRLILRHVFADLWVADPSVEAEVREGMAEYLRRLSQVYLEASQTGELSPDTDAKLLAEMTIDAYMANWRRGIYQGHDVDRLTRRFERMLRVLLAGAGAGARP